jgi:hypothetical protein
MDGFPESTRENEFEPSNTSLTIITPFMSIAPKYAKILPPIERCKKYRGGIIVLNRVINRREIQVNHSKRRMEIAKTGMNTQ